jgi:uncharacterized protein (TIGR03067 family)
VASVAQGDDAKKDVAKKLTGTWIVESATLNGKEIFPRKDGQVVFSEDQVTTSPAKGKGWTQKFTIDPSKKPNEINFEFVGEVPKAFQKDRTLLKGIFELDGDSLKLCLRGGKRPTEFSDKGQHLLGLRRKK